MPTHLYCLLPAGSSVEPPPAVRSLVTRAGVAWIGDADAAALSRDARGIARATVAHDAVCGFALARGVTPIPAALADPYTDDDAVRADVDAQAALASAVFPAIAGMVEMTAIVVLNDASPASDAPRRGRAYLERLRDMPARAAAIADRIERQLGAFADARRRADGSRVALSHLVPRSAEPAYREAVGAAGDDGYHIVIDGPRAPYSFALFAPRRGIQTQLWVGQASVSARHDSGDLDRERQI